MTVVITPDMLRRISPTANTGIISHLGPALTRSFPAGDIKTELRAAHFLAQAAHESDGFRTLVEYGGARYFSRYDGRRDLGNTQPGDGARYRGRGIFQLTGRANYRTFGGRIGVDLERQPDRASEPDISARTAMAYWFDRGLNGLADRDDLVGVTKRINGGRNGLADRQAKLIRAKAALQGRSGAEAVAEIQERAQAAGTAARRATAGAGGAAAGGSVVVGIPQQSDPAAGSGSVVGAVLVAGLIFGGAVIWLLLRARSKRVEQRELAANAAQGVGE